MNKVVDIKEAVKHIKQGDILMVGGFGGFGVPGNLIKEIVRQNIGDLTVIAEDFSSGLQSYERGLGPLLNNRLVKKAIISYAAGQPIISELVFAGELELEMVPQGTLAERIRAGGAGLGGFYTPTGVGTVIAEGKETRMIDGREYLLEKPLKSNVSIIKAYKADKMGNAIFKYTGQTFNTCMATAGEIVILEAEEVVEIGELAPDAIHLPGVFVDYVVEQKEVAL